MARPFLKWAGGKGQLLPEIQKKYPAGLGRTINRYCEPFIGGGAVLFDILKNYKIKDVYISDINRDLINTYLVIQNDVQVLIKKLEKLQDKYIALNSNERKSLYGELRDEFNNLKINHFLSQNVEKAVLFIFLNKTCFNGLYRVNKKGLFNVPMGLYKKPLICDKNNLMDVSKILKNVEIYCEDYSNAMFFIDEKTLVYIDPPYRPLTETSSFNSYNKVNFDDKEQIRLADFVKSLDRLGAKVIISNSDPKNIDIDDVFFDELYSTFFISRVTAKRMINSKISNRGAISELLINNYGSVLFEKSR